MYAVFGDFVLRSITRDRDENAASLQYSPRTFQRVTPNGVNNYIDI
jgi:hypothetical protein